MITTTIGNNSNNNNIIIYMERWRCNVMEAVTV